MGKGGCFIENSLSSLNDSVTCAEQQTVADKNNKSTIRFIRYISARIHKGMLGKV